MENSRTKTISKNAIIGVAMQIIALICSFGVRTAFIYILSQEYLGVNGLFSSILSYLSLAELGVGTGISVFLYKPLAENDQERIKSLMAFYKKCYIIIGIIITVVGLALIPFLDYLVSGDLPEDLNLVAVYCLFLLNSSSTYFFSYRSSLLIADQKDYLVSVITQIFTIARDVILLAILILIKSYYIYLVGQIITNLLMYGYIYLKTNKMYPYLKEKNYTPLTKEEKHKIYVNVSSLMIYKLAGIVLSSSDNIIISSMIDITAVAILSNYTLITNSVKTIVRKVSDSFTATIANYKECGASIDKQEEVFRCAYIIVFCCYAMCSVCLSIFFNKVIMLWIGENYLFDTAIVLVIVFYFFLEGIGQLTYSYRTTYKLFNESRFAPVMAAIINIVLSILFAYLWGVFGVLLATPIARLLTYSWVDPYLLYKRAFNKSPLRFYCKYFGGIIYLAIMYVIVYFVVNLVPYTNFGMLILQMLICIVLTAILILLFILPQKEFKYIKEKVFNLFSKK